MDKSTLAKYIDHTLLKPATEEQLTTLCNEAKLNGFASVCVNPVNVALCAKLLADSQVKVCTVIGFPLGENTSQVKAYETKCAIADGATEIDMVICQSYAKSNMWQQVQEEIQAVVESAEGVLVKVILETCNLTDDQIVNACKASIGGGAIFVKTSTGFGSGGATAHHVQLMHDTVSDSGLYVKASGGVRSYQDAMTMIEAGASRIGTSNGVAIVNKAEGSNNY